MSYTPSLYFDLDRRKLSTLCEKRGDRECLARVHLSFHDGIATFMATNSYILATLEVSECVATETVDGTAGRPLLNEERFPTTGVSITRENMLALEKGGRARFYITFETGQPVALRARDSERIPLEWTDEHNRPPAHKHLIPTDSGITSPGPIGLDPRFLCDVVQAIAPAKIGPIRLERAVSPTKSVVMRSTDGPISGTALIMPVRLDVR